MKHFHICFVMILNCLLAVGSPRLALAVVVQMQPTTHVQGILNLAGPNACAQVFALTMPHALRDQGGRSTQTRQLDKHHNEVVTELAQLATAINQAIANGQLAEAKVLRRHLIERYRQARSIGIDLSAYDALTKQIKNANETLSEEARRQDQAHKQTKASERRFLPWVTLKTLSGHIAAVRSASFSPDGTRIVTSSNDKTARIWDVISGKLVITLSGHTDYVTSGQFSPDGLRVVTASNDKTARIWDAITGETVAILSGHTDFVRSASFSPDGKRIVTASSDKTAMVWDAKTCKPIARLLGHTASIPSATFSRDGMYIVTASLDTTARIWHAVNGDSIAILSGHTDFWVRSATFSLDGSRIVTASSDKTARIWDVMTGESNIVLVGHAEEVTSASISADGLQVLTSSDDKTARIWDVTTGGVISVLTGHTGMVHEASYSSDGLRIVTASSDKTARIWIQVGIENVRQNRSTGLSDPEFGQLR